VQVEQGQINAALDTLKKGKHALQTNPEGRLVSAVVQSLVHTRSGKPDEAAKALDEAARLRQEGARMDGPLMLELANTCLAHGRHDEADQLVAEVARNAHDSEALLAKAKQLYDDAGRGHEAQKLLMEATADVRNLNNEGVMLAHKKDFGPAVERMLEACRLAPYNPRVLMNGIWVILKSLEQGGMDEDRLGKARHYLTQVEKLSPGHTRLVGLRNHLKDIESRFGIRRRTGS
jgi:Flp pilus assembly protein TadD